MRASYTGVLVTAANRVLFIFSLVVLLSGCEQYYGLDNRQLKGWFNENKQHFNTIAKYARGYSIHSEIGLRDFPASMQGKFESRSQKERIASSMKAMFQVLGVKSEQVVFHHKEHIGLSHVVVSLYMEGGCLALSNCQETYLVYYSDDSELIVDKSYSYTSLEDGWFILKVE
ncbi:hypothetical protein [Pseudoalteromonas sp. PPB1]|uniref:hypothetical protein n=1 Tax=Pseudoalteromonas sp. PPB1 TaxID=2756136 RepID=UPI00189134AE|nr:hypothetical protein [Pseudoalteromonas sp. PPB1]